MITFNLSAPDRTLFSDTARDLALACTPDRDKKKKNATAQIRRFYDEVVFWHDRVLKESDPELGFLKAEPFIQMLKAKATTQTGGTSSTTRASTFSCGSSTKSATSKP